MNQPISKALKRVQQLDIKETLWKSVKINFVYKKIKYSSVDFLKNNCLSNYKK